jgi:iron complex transport system ATP-binding protein
VTTAPPLATRDLNLRVGDHWLVRNLTVEFRAGENWAVLGANGSGKTTLLHALAGLRMPDSGCVLLDGGDLFRTARRQRARRIGVLFQDPHHALTTTVRETVLTGRHPYLGRWQPEGPDDHARADAALAAVGLGGFADRLTDSLSGGERRRMELATLLTQDAPLCLLDEPANHLDPHFQVELLARISERTLVGGRLSVMVLHDINLALRFCSHGLLLLPGGETRHGPLATLFDAALLSRVYGCPMRELRADTLRLFIPT